MAVCDAGRAQHSDSPAIEVASTQSKRATSAMHVSSSMHVFLQTAQVMVLRPGAQPIQNFKYVLGMSKVFPRFVASDTSMF